MVHERGRLLHTHSRTWDTTPPSARDTQHTGTVPRSAKLTVTHEARPNCKDLKWLHSRAGINRESQRAAPGVTYPTNPDHDRPQRFRKHHQAIQERSQQYQMTRSVVVTSRLRWSDVEHPTGQPGDMGFIHTHSRTQLRQPKRACPPSDRRETSSTSPF